ncbi:caspase family protein [Streptomyces smyrnaeus]|uniref:caspase family protein n=1 Tax=Streptomyces smyrnaeus TaxID=1387713 RepID=UPI0033B1144D
MGLPDPDRTRVVLIGTAEYQHFPDSPAVHNNISRLAELFRSPHIGGLPAGHCVTAPDPTRADDVLDLVHQAASEATDTLVVYFAGHGMRLPDGSLYLALQNSEQGKKPYKSLAFNYVRNEMLEVWLPARW